MAYTHEKESTSATCRKKQKNGSGNILQKGNRFYGRLFLGYDSDGSKKYANFSGNTKTEVKQKIAEYKKNNATPNSKTSVEHYMLYWMKTFKRGRIRDTSYDRIETTVTKNIIPYIGYYQLESLTSSEINTFLNHLKDDAKLSYSSIKKAYDCLRAALDLAARQNAITQNPMSDMSMLSPDGFQTKEIQVFTKDETKLIVAECKRRYSNNVPVRFYGDAFLLILNTGLRVSEALALELRDWDKEGKMIQISKNNRATFKRDKNGERTGGKEIVQGKGKTPSSRRSVPLNAEATAALERMEKRAIALNSDRFICAKNGNPVHTDRLERAWYSLLDHINVKQAGLHTLRHTFASNLFQKKIDIKVISSLLGHKSVGITYNTYVHLIPENLTDAVKAIEATNDDLTEDEE